MNKEVEIILSEEANKQYEELNQIVGEEIRKGVGSSFHQTLLKAINRVKELLRKNPFLGNQIHKRLVPKKYLNKYGVDNLWRVELPNRWRLLYSIYGEELKITNFVLDFFDHKNYNKLFKYD